MGRASAVRRRPTRDPDLCGRSRRRDRCSRRPRRSSAHGSDGVRRRHRVSAGATSAPLAVASPRHRRHRQRCDDGCHGRAHTAPRRRRDPHVHRRDAVRAPDHPGRGRGVDARRVPGGRAVPARRRSWFGRPGHGGVDRLGAGRRRRRAKPTGVRRCDRGPGAARRRDARARCTPACRRGAAAHRAWNCTTWWPTAWR